MYQIQLNATPNEADIAIVSIDKYGISGLLNEMVLKEYGYSSKDLPKGEKLDSGFYGLYDEKRKPILFVVTIDGSRTVADNLADNLYKTLVEFHGLFRDKTLWLPLLGTGAGKLSFEESYDIIKEVLDKFFQRFKAETNIIVSIPNEPAAINFFRKISGNIIIENNSQNPFTYGQTLEEFVQKLNCNFYLVGSIWDSNDQSERFFKEGIWETGYGDDRYAAIINNVKINDVLIIKSTFAANNISYLRIKAFGIARQLSEDGTSLTVQWTITNLNIDIENLGGYRSTITKISIDIAMSILTHLDPILWGRLQQPNNNQNSKIHSIAGLVSDADTGVDYLDITKDVAAFARVITARGFEPPLAIALFGKWGSGKSFFMRKLKDAVIDLSNRNPFNAYCKGIAHIHFNAWSYVDANLWASLVNKIFEGLNEYISSNTKSSEEKKSIEKQLGQKLTVVKEEVSILENKKSSIVKQIEDLKKRKDSLDDSLKHKISKIEKNTLWDVINNINKEFKVKEKIVETLNENKSLVATEEELKEIIPEKYWIDPNESYEQAKSKYTFLKEFFKKEKVLWNIAALAFVITIIFLVPYYIKTISETLRNANFFIPQAIFSSLVIIGAVWKRAEDTYKKLKPVIASFWKIKVEYDKKIEEAVSKYEQEEKALKLEIEKEKAELTTVDQQIQQAITVKVDIEFRINNALGTEALYAFIERRAKSDDYKKYLGIISVIRRDFEVLNDLFTDHNTEAKKDKKEAEEFRKKFTKPLERIILYIDDLDRCPEENVVQVLDAVNLLMAYPLFIVIVGVDPRWVKNALIKKHSLQFIGKLNNDHNTIDNLEVIEPSNYLEKIFQIPFHLKDAQKKDVRHMIKNLAQTKPKVTFEDSTPDDLSDSTESDTITETKTNAIESAESETVITQAQEMDKPEAVEISSVEIEMLQDIGEIIGENPRALKRFINTYKIIKAHEDFSYDKNSEKNELLIIMFLLALPIGNYKHLLYSFEEFMNKNSTKKLSAYLTPNHDLKSLNELKHKLDVLLTGRENYNILQNQECGFFLDHNEFIRRFTFKNM